MNNIYLNTAAMYDYDNRSFLLEDIPFYIERAKQSGGDVLELACGTGRISIPLVEAGISITALDYSETMLAVMQQKIAQLPASLQSQIKTVHGDMSNFELFQTYQLIFIPFRSFQLLEDDEQAKSCLATVHRHLESDGTFILNVFKPYKEMGDWWINLEESLDFEFNREDGKKVRRYSIKKAIDYEARHLFIEFIYRIYEDEQLLEEYRDCIRMRYFYEDDIVRLVYEAGFRIVEALGWYDGRPVHEGNEFIFVCHK